MNKKGFLNIIIAVIVAVAIAGGAYFVINKKNIPTNPSVIPSGLKPYQENETCEPIIDPNHMVVGDYRLSCGGQAIYSINKSNPVKIIDLKDLFARQDFINFININEQLGVTSSSADDINSYKYGPRYYSRFEGIFATPDNNSIFVNVCLRCNEDLIGGYASFFINALTHDISGYFLGKGGTFSPNGQYVILRPYDGGEVTAFSVNVYDVSSAKLIGTLSSRGAISNFAQKTFNITADTYVTFDFSPDSKSIIITPQVFDGNNYKPFASKLISDLDGKNLRVM